MRLNNNQLSLEKELEMINSYTRKPLKKEDVYIFTLTLCDNEVDRDFECFNEKSLMALKELFLGKTGISDHSMLSKDQSARIFHCYIEKDNNKLTSYGEKYIALKARAYMLKTQSNTELIAEIDGGIKKEVSVSCSARDSLCSICGENMRSNKCSHIKGRTYGGKLCYATLENISDAYEWSFVAVPAQRQAGVSKSFKVENEKTSSKNDIVTSIFGGAVLSEKKANELSEYISKLKKSAEDAEYFKKYLLEEISRYALIIMPRVNSKQFVEGCMAMDTLSLKKLKDDMQNQANAIAPISLQLKPMESKKNRTNTDFII